MMKKILLLLLVTALLCALCLPALAQSADNADSYNDTDATTADNTDILLRILIPVLLGIGLALTVVLLMKRSMSTVRKQKSADRYTEEGSFSLTESRDIFLYSTVTRVRVNSNSNRRR